MAIFAVVTATASPSSTTSPPCCCWPRSRCSCQGTGNRPRALPDHRGIASQIGGTATLIGDPPNIMIGPRAGLDFHGFPSSTWPRQLYIMAAWMLVWKVLFGNRLQVGPAQKARILAIEGRRPSSRTASLAKSLVVLALTILGFMLHGFWATNRPPWPCSAPRHCCSFRRGPAAGPGGSGMAHQLFLHGPFHHHGGTVKAGSSNTSPSKSSP